MKRESCVRYLVGAALVLLIGAVWALAEEIEMNVEVRNEGGQVVTVDINGVTETVRVGDLAEGEQRTFDVGDHKVVVKRVGDSLVLINDEHGLAELEEAGEDHAYVVVTDEDESCDHPCRRVVIMKTGDGQAIDIEELEGGGDKILIFTEDEHEGDRELHWVAEGEEGSPVFIKKVVRAGGDFVTYRCEETGSTLIVKAGEKLLDDYIDPVTGCVMKKIDNAGARVIEIREEIVKEEEE